MNPFDTIAAPATASQDAGVAIVRISGPDALRVAQRVFPRLARGHEPRRLVLGRIVAPGDGRLLDRGLAVVMPGPGSFTGEDVVELHCHGGLLNVQRVLGAVLRAGARAAEPGEFSRRAFLNGRLDLVQAEAIADIVGARSQAALDVAQQQLAGALSAQVTALRDAIATTLAHLEVNIDFSSEDVPSYPPSALADDMDAAREAILALTRSFDQGRVLRDGVRVALAGRTNAGKSSIFNALLREHRAIVTDVPGTTRDFLEEPANLGGVPVVLVDTAGLRETDDPVEREGVARTRGRIAASDVVLCVFDGSRAPHGEDIAVQAAVAGRRVVFALNKSDLPTAEGWAEAAPLAIPISAERGDGLDSLVAALVAAAGLEGAGMATAAIITRERHRDALARAADALERAAGAARGGLPYEIVAGELMLALEGLGDIVGVTTAEDILDRVFSEFCIGK